MFRTCLVMHTVDVSGRCTNNEVTWNRERKMSVHDKLERATRVLVEGRCV